MYSCDNFVYPFRKQLRSETQSLVLHWW